MGTITFDQVAVIGVPFVSWSSVQRMAVKVCDVARSGIGKKDFFIAITARQSTTVNGATESF